MDSSDHYFELFGEIHFTEQPAAPPVASAISLLLPHPTLPPPGTSTLERLMIKECRTLEPAAAPSCFDLFGETQYFTEPEAAAAEAAAEAAAAEEALLTDRSLKSPSLAQYYSSRCEGELPPPISTIGKDGKPWLRLKHYREGGRLMIRGYVDVSGGRWIAVREDGRLSLHFAVQSMQR